jgi:hypothetical protein
MGCSVDCDNNMMMGESAVRAELLSGCGEVDGLPQRIGRQGSLMSEGKETNFFMGQRI